MKWYNCACYLTQCFSTFSLINARNYTQIRVCSGLHENFKNFKPLSNFGWNAASGPALEGDELCMCGWLKLKLEYTVSASEPGSVYCMFRHRRLLVHLTTRLKKNMSEYVCVCVSNTGVAALKPSVRYNAWQQFHQQRHLVVFIHLNTSMFLLYSVNAVWTNMFTFMSPVFVGSWLPRDSWVRRVAY